MIVVGKEFWYRDRSGVCFKCQVAHIYRSMCEVLICYSQNTPVQMVRVRITNLVDQVPEGFQRFDYMK